MRRAKLITSRANVFYLSGFSSTNAFIVLLDGKRYFFTDARYYESAKNLKGFKVILIRSSLIRSLKEIIREEGVEMLEVESSISLSLFNSLKKLGVKLKPIRDILRGKRMVKSKKEIEILREGVKRLDKVFYELLENLDKFRTEREVRAFVVKRFFDLNSEGESFPTIVAFGKNSAIPHWKTSDQKIGRGNLLIDMGLIWKGYCTDFTRVIHLGRPSSLYEKVFNIVRDAHLFALEGVKVGVSVGEIDRRAREYIRSKGFGKFFTHATGHGIGVEIHEPPRVFFKEKTKIEEGMVFTIEPGIYLPSKFGIRLENMVVVEGGVGNPLSEVPLQIFKV